MIKKLFIVFATLSVLLYPINQASSSDLSELLKDITGKTLCQLPMFNTISGFDQYCSNAGAGDRGFGEPEIMAYFVGRSVINGFGCETNMYDPKGKNKEKHVALLGDSLTHLGFGDQN